MTSIFLIHLILLSQEFNLDESFVYRIAGRIILVSKKPSQVIEKLIQLLNCIRSSSHVLSSSSETSSMCDIVIGACIRSCSSPELIESLIKLLNSDINKIDAFILSGKLRPAYLLAIRLEREVDVKRILAVAERTNQEAVKGWCLQWLNKRSQLKS